MGQSKSSRQQLANGPLPRRSSTCRIDKENGKEITKFGQYLPTSPARAACPLKDYDHG